MLSLFPVVGKASTNATSYSTYAVSLFGLYPLYILRRWYVAISAKSGLLIGWSCAWYIGIPQEWCTISRRHTLRTMDNEDNPDAVLSALQSILNEINKDWEDELSKAHANVRRVLFQLSQQVNFSLGERWPKILGSWKVKQSRHLERRNKYVSKTLGERSPWLINKSWERDKESKIESRSE